MGIKHLLDDYDSINAGGILRRPVRRQVIAITDHTEKTFRNS